MRRPWVAQQFGSPLVYANVGSQGFYAQDNWKVRPNATLTLGLRYEYDGTPGNQLKYPTIDPYHLDNYLVVIKEEAATGDIGPRVGFTYSPRLWPGLFGDNKTVIRGGFGVFFDGFYTNILDNTQSSSPNVSSPSITNQLSGRGTANWSQQLPNLDPAPSPYGFQWGMATHLLSPKILQWDLNIQRELPQHFLGSVGYVGTRGEHLFGNNIVNYLDPNTGNFRDPNRGYIAYHDNSGDSIYHGLIADLERQFTHGLSFRASYAYSRAEDDTSEIYSSGTLSSIPMIQWPVPRKKNGVGFGRFRPSPTVNVHIRLQHS